MGLTFKTSKWLDKLWSEHLCISKGAQTLLKQGISKQGKSFAGFPADIHARLYLPRDPAQNDNNTGWATRLHSLAGELREWAQLRSMCARNGFAAGIATEVLLEQLLPLVPERPEESAPEAPPTPTPQGSSKSPSNKYELRYAGRQEARRMPYRAQKPGLRVWQRPSDSRGARAYAKAAERL